jgi:hypothetical protein
MAKAAFDRKKALFVNKQDLGLRRKLVKCSIWKFVCVVLKFGRFGK